MEIVDDPCLAEAHVLTASSRQNRLSDVMYTMIDRELGAYRPKPSMQVPPAFTTGAVMDQLVEGSLDLSEMLRSYLETTAEAFLPSDLSGELAADFQPRACDAKFVNCTIISLPPEMQAYTWKSLDHASLGLSMFTSHLYGCNVAAKLFEKARNRSPIEDTTEYQVVAAKARDDIGIMVGSMPYLYMEAEGIDGVSANDYMWLHNAVPFVVALESPFATDDQRDYILTAMQYVADVKGIQMTNGVLNQYRSSRQSSTTNCSANMRHTRDSTTTVTTC